MDELFNLLKWLVFLPFCGLMIVCTIALAISLAEVVFTVLTRLKWRLIDYFDRKFFK